MNRGTLLSALALVVAGLASPPSARADGPSRLCRATAKWFETTRRLDPLEARRRLERVMDAEPGCALVQAAAVARVDKDWEGLVPVADRAMPRARLNREVARIKQLSDLAQLMLRLRAAPDRPRTALTLGRLYEGMAVFLDQMGGASGQTFVMREQAESLYHSRAVDLRELLKLRAEEAYELSIRLLRDASTQNETLLEARARLSGLKERYAARQAPPPLPVDDEQPPIAAP